MNNKIVHGHKRAGRTSPTYHSWVEMRRRCLTTTFARYKDYGGRGITICDRWLESFVNFLADMGERPAGLTLDRIDNDGNYEPGNCRWATQSEQVRNQRPRNHERDPDLCKHGHRLLIVGVWRNGGRLTCAECCKISKRRYAAKKNLPANPAPPVRNEAVDATFRVVEDDKDE